MHSEATPQPKPQSGLSAGVAHKRSTEHNSSGRRSSSLGKAGGAGQVTFVCLARELPTMARAAHSPRGEAGLGG